MFRNTQYASGNPANVMENATNAWSTTRTIPSIQCHFAKNQKPPELEKYISN
jgi:hypothetical protein